MNRCGSFPLLSAPHPLFGIWIDLKISEKLPEAPMWRWGEWIWLTEPSGLHRKSLRGQISVPSGFLTRSDCSAQGQVFHCKLRNQGCSFTRDLIGAVSSRSFPHPTLSLASGQALKQGSSTFWVRGPTYIFHIILRAAVISDYRIIMDILNIITGTWAARQVTYVGEVSMT